MKIYVKKNFYSNKITIALLVIGVILCSGHALQTIIWQIEYLPILGTILFFFPILKIYIHKRLNIYSVSLLIFGIMICTTMVANLDFNLRQYILFFCIIFSAFGISLKYSFDDMIKIYLKLMDLVTLIGIVGYYLINNTGLLDFLPKVTNLNDVTYSMGIIFNSIDVISERNCAMFWEPGLFATYLTIALVFEFYYKNDKPNLIRVLLYSAGILTAHSSAGYVLLVLCIFLYLTKEKQSRNRGIIKCIQIMLFLGFIVVLLNYETIIFSTSLKDNEYIQKLLMENMNESLRALAIKHNLEIFIENPVFGAGISNVLLAVKYVADTSTSTYLLSIYGILGIMHTGLWAYALFSDKKGNIYSKILLFSIFMSILNKEPHTNLLFTWCLLFWLLKETALKNERNINEKVNFKTQTLF